MHYTGILPLRSIQTEPRTWPYIVRAIIGHKPYYYYYYYYYYCTASNAPLQCNLFLTTAASTPLHQLLVRPGTLQPLTANVIWRFCCRFCLDKDATGLTDSHSAGVAPPWETGRVAAGSCGVVLLYARRASHCDCAVLFTV